MFSKFSIKLPLAFSTDCFFRLNELHFALADYHQALEMDHSDWMIRSRIASIHSEFGLLDYEEHNYQEAEARFTVAIQYNPRMGSYYVYRAKVRFKDFRASQG